MKLGVKFPESGNKLWYNQALYYFNFNRNAGTFCKEMLFIKKELGIVSPTVQKAQ